MKTIKNTDLFRQLMPIFIFVITLLVSNLIWKLMIDGDELGVGDVKCCGMVVTPIFDFFTIHTAQWVYRLVSLVRDTVYQTDAVIISFLSGTSLKVVWSCTPLKQCFILFFLILTTVGEWRNKIWYIPFCWIILYIVNILRITIITLVIEHHVEMFDLMHSYIMKYAFYIILFLLWVLYEEKVRFIGHKAT